LEIGIMVSILDNARTLSPVATLTLDA